MVPEIRVSLTNDSQYKLEALKDGKIVPAYLPDLIQRDPNNLTFVFEGPLTLQHVIEAIRGVDHPSAMVCILQKMQRMRLCLFHPLNNSKSPEGRRDSGAFEAPDLAPLMHAWQEAFHAIPTEHQLREIEIDLTCNEAVDLREPERLLRHVMENMSTKNDQIVKFVLVGCTDEDRTQMDLGI